MVWVRDPAGTLWGEGGIPPVEVVEPEGPDDPTVVFESVRSHVRALLEFIPEEHHAAIRAGESTYDARAALQAAIIAVAEEGGGTVLLPQGRVYINAASGAVEMRSYVTILGAGMGVSTIFFDDSAFATSSTPGRPDGLFVRPAGASVTNIRFERFTIQNSGQTTRAQNSTNAIYLVGTSTYTISRVVLQELETLDTRAVAVMIRLANDVTASRCRFERSSRGGLQVWRTPYVRIVDCFFRHCWDDAIGVHSSDADTPPIRSRIVVSRNTVMMSNGIVVLGAKHASITDNQLFLTMARGIRVNASNSDDGDVRTDTPVIAVRVAGNIICDQIRRPPGLSGGGKKAYMRISGGVAGAGADTAYPGRPRADGTFVPLFGSNAGTHYAADADGSAGVAQACSPGAGIIVEGNIMMRTLPAVSAVSDWGYGPLFCGDNLDGWYDDEITETELACDGMILAPFLDGADIRGNFIRITGDYAIRLAADAEDDPTDGVIPDLSYRSVEITGNQLIGASAAAIRWGTTSLSRQDIRIRRNIINGDPYHVHENRGTNGGWTVNSGCAGISIVNGGGFTVEANEFSNVRIPLVAASGIHTVLNNTVVGIPTDTAYHSNNRGVGNLPTAWDGWRIRVVECNPTSSDFGHTTFAAPLSATAQPSTGRWLAGQFVLCSDPTLRASGVLGWRRLTTGNSHTGSDWQAEVSA